MITINQNNNRNISIWYYSQFFFKSLRRTHDKKLNKQYLLYPDRYVWKFRENGFSKIWVHLMRTLVEIVRLNYYEKYDKKEIFY